MPRKPRIEFCGAFYHIIIRGNQRQKVFLDDRDRTEYLDRLNRYWKRYDFSLYAYTLMNNHIHLLMETRDNPLSKVMQGINQSYTQYFNKRHRKVGHLFQGRYKAVLCDKESYLLELVRYIHLNPVRAKMEKNPINYLWSSHGTYMNGEGMESIDTEAILGLFSIKSSEARRRYNTFVMEGIRDGQRPDYYSDVLGGEGFLTEIEGRSKKKGNDTVKRRYPLGDLIKAIEKTTSVSKDKLIGRERKPQISLARNLLVHIARKHSYLKDRDVASFLKRDPSLLIRMDRSFKEKWQGTEWPSIVLKYLNINV